MGVNRTEVDHDAVGAAWTYRVGCAGEAKVEMYRSHSDAEQLAIWRMGWGRDDDTRQQCRGREGRRKRGSRGRMSRRWACHTKVTFPSVWLLLLLREGEGETGLIRPQQPAARPAQ